MDQLTKNVRESTESGTTKATTSKALPESLINAVNKKFGISQIAGLDEVQLKIAGAIA